MSPINKKGKSLIDYFKYFALTQFILLFLYPLNPNALKAGLEFQWENKDNFKRLKWFQKDNKKNSKNTIFLFLRESDRKTGLLNIKLRVPDDFASKIKKEKISFCQARIGGYTKRTKCLKNIPTEIEIDKEKNSVNIFPLSPIPSSKENYAIVLKVTNPNRGGLFQFHSFGQSSGNIPVSFYLGSWTLKMQSQ
tara:strand:- start:566 stop:1144 length:579 start_codon:yes stop_codon:yes gene_type:complete